MGFKMKKILSAVLLSLILTPSLMANNLFLEEINAENSNQNSEQIAFSSLKDTKNLSYIIHLDRENIIFTDFPTINEDKSRSVFVHLFETKNLNKLHMIYAKANCNTEQLTIVSVTSFYIDNFRTENYNYQNKITDVSNIEENKYSIIDKSILDYTCEKQILKDNLQPVNTSVLIENYKKFVSETN